jgi:pimeloyl-ACP methyl ester carboxylesterase
MRRSIEVPEYDVEVEVRVDPARTGLVVVDMQKDFVRDGGGLLVPDAEATTVIGHRGRVDADVDYKSHELAMSAHHSATTLPSTSNNSNERCSVMSDPTVVLVHGAFTDASSWRRLYEELAGDDLMIKAPPNPLRGIGGGDAEYTKSVIAQIDGPVLLVGHSYGGAVISAAGAADNVVGLVYVAGFAPDEGETLAALQSNFPAAPSGQYFTASPLSVGGTEFSLDPSGFHEVFAADLPESEAAFMAISQRPLSGVALAEPAPAPAWRSRRSWGVLPTADRAIHPELHRFSYDRMGAMVTEVEGASHVVMMSRPDVVAEVVREAVRALVPVVDHVA